MWLSPSSSSPLSLVERLRWRKASCELRPPAWVLWLAWVPLAWGYFEYQRTHTRKLGLAIEQVATFTLILLALAQLLA